MRPELEEAIALLRRGDEPAVQRALELLQRTVLSFGLKVCGHREDAEDTAQEVLVKALPYLAKFEGPQVLSAWLYTAAKESLLAGTAHGDVSKKRGAGAAAARRQGTANAAGRCSGEPGR